MKFIGVDLHKNIITVCVMNEKLSRHCSEDPLLQSARTRSLSFSGSSSLSRVVVEATASYCWFVKLVEPLAEKVVLANPNKLRVIAESTKKTDRLDAQVLAEFLTRDMIPESYMPTARHR